MSNVEVDPVEIACGEDRAEADVELIPPREVPLGGPRAMLVRRTLPSRGRTMVGAWCFADHYGPDHVSETGGMVVPPHPHTGLQTVSWLFTGEIEHRDSLGTVAPVRPGELNLMTSGRGISHSEVSTAATDILHGVQLWVALPEEARGMAPEFENYVPEPYDDGAVRLAVFVGGLGLADGTRLTSPVRMHTPILGAELTLCPGADVALAVDPAYEHGVLVDGGQVEVLGEVVPQGTLGYVAPGARQLRLRAGEHGARAVLLGGTPFGEQIVMWWNFIGRSHEEVVASREQWQAEIGGAEAVQFGRFDYDGDPLPAPGMPGVRLRPRG
ncbi:pirin family protein [Ornithinicoccus hortensis]|uniref:Pirin n=1 Tax=Ornithinicoccus hortensis TaxID=82346 RepID=A0A542YNS3_9MICO|nr:pirin family protein [Ornithinicoccus hortensis]TQL49750.1 hypothetical protein FB467_0841 [Ornithinicoccus hortensis]